MPRLLEKNLFCLCCLLFFGSQTFAQDIQCDEANRPTLESCSNQPKETTCAFYQALCPLEGGCGKPAENPCEACSDPYVLYYRKEECDPANLFETCYNSGCDPEESGISDQSYAPVCAFQTNEQPIQETIDNVCKLCLGGQYFTFQRGPCQQDRVYCGSNSPENTDSGTDPVCASFQAKDSNTAYVTVPNASDACSDPAVEFWIKGECGLMANHANYCLPNKRPENCERDFNPVCGFYYEDDVMKHKVMDTACAACADPEIIYHTPGPCFFTCYPQASYNPSNYVGKLFPSCGTYEGSDGQELKVSLSNPTVGCHPSGKPILSYEDGLCPGDKGIRCEDDAGGFLSFEPHVVCAYSTEDCEDDSCRQTYSEPAFACRNGQNIGYFPGPCPGDVGIPCEEDLRGISWVSVVNVCGYSTLGCSDPSCRIDFRSYFEACGISNIIYVLPGMCNAIN